MDQGGWRKQNGKPLGLDERENDRHILLLHRWVQVSEQSTINMITNNIEGIWGLSLCPRGLGEKEVSSTCQRCVILDGKRQAQLR